MFRLKYKSLAVKRDRGTVDPRVRLRLILGDFVHSRENLIPPHGED